MQEFVVDLRGYVEEIVHGAIRKLQLQGPIRVRIRMESNLGNSC